MMENYSGSEIVNSEERFFNHEDTKTLVEISHDSAIYAV
jgi:hypothetical protein